MRALLVALAMVAVFAIAAAGSSKPVPAGSNCCPDQALCPGCDGCN